MKKKISLVLCTVPDVRSGRKIADFLLKEKLAACVSIVPRVESHYVWKGKREKSVEAMLIIKTGANRYKNLEKAIKIKHPYECPEILQISVDDAFKPYVHWVFEQVKSMEQ